MIYSSNSMNTFRQREDDLEYRLTILNENTWILIIISMKYILKGPVGSKSALFQVMACHCIGNKALHYPMVTLFTDCITICMYHQASMS